MKLLSRSPYTLYRAHVASFRSVVTRTAHLCHGNVCTQRAYLGGRWHKGAHCRPRAPSKETPVRTSKKQNCSPIDRIVTLDCCFLTGILHSTFIKMCSISWPWTCVITKRIKFQGITSCFTYRKNADAISMHDIQRQRCIKTGLHRAQEVPLCRQRTHPSISRLKPNMLFQIQTDRIHTNTTRQRSTAKACILLQNHWGS